MIPILQSIRNLRLISFPSSKPLSNRTGSSFSNTITGNMRNLLSRSSVAMAKPFPKIPSVLCVVLLITTFMTIMVETVSTSAKSAVRLSLPAKSSQHHFDLPALTAEIHLLPGKTVSSSAYINV